MKTSWLAGLNAAQVREIRSDFKGSGLTRKRLTELLEAKLKNSASRDKAAYESPSWAYAQADSIGYERALLEVISLISDETVDK